MSERRVKITKGPYAGKEGILDGESMLQQAVRVHIPGEHVARMFPISHIEVIDKPEPREWR